jgi:hypothetical protein
MDAMPRSPCVTELALSQILPKVSVAYIGPFSISRRWSRGLALAHNSFGESANVKDYPSKSCSNEAYGGGNVVVNMPS